MEGQEPKTDQLKAAALSFDEARDMAPRLMARGEGELGERILELARRHNVTIVQDPSLTDFLQGVKVGQEIPENLYRAVSRIFAYLYQTQGKY
ncbi:MAG: hypothetical protein CMN76_14590 [Spirochaetaceae bacterium]|nr:hypothetical protein [Spirochaetaceae bacterium]|tara:strand:+ start:83192 stop:83470 length:279 start_codon:yes stop_codon:yes gene_type:complete